MKIGPLDNDSVLKVAKMYLPEDANVIEKDLIKALKKTTAAEVKEIINDSISVALSEGIEFDAGLIMKVRAKIKASMSDNNFRDEDDYPELREESWNASKDLENPMDWLDE